jgi:hypothetical protein
MLDKTKIQINRRVPYYGAARSFLLTLGWGGGGWECCVRGIARANGSEVYGARGSGGSRGAGVHSWGVRGIGGVGEWAGRGGVGVQGELECIVVVLGGVGVLGEAGVLGGVWGAWVLGGVWGVGVHGVVGTRGGRGSICCPY